MLRDEIKNHMSGLHLDASGAICASFAFPRDFTGFDGHFPGLPILPGVCTLQAVLSMVEAQQGCRLHMEEIVQAKFSALVFPDQTLEYVCTESKADGNATFLKAVITRQDAKIAEILMKVSANGSDIVRDRPESGAAQ